MFFLLVFLVAGGIGLVYVLNNSTDKQKERDDADDQIGSGNEEIPITERLHPIPVGDGLGAANAKAKEISTNAVLVEAADDEGESPLYFTVGEKREVNKLFHTTARSRQWLYIYLRDPQKINLADIKSEDGFILKYNSEGIDIFQEKLFPNSSYSEIKDITEQLQKLGSDEAYNIVWTFFTDMRKEHQLDESNIKEVNMYMRYVQYTGYSIYDGEIKEIYPVWKIEIKMNDEKAADGERRYKANVRIDNKEVDNDYVSE